MSLSADQGKSKIELDSHADLPVVGNNAYIIERTGKKVSISGFTDELGKSLLVDVVNAAVVYDCDTTGESYLLLLHNTLYVHSLSSCLINPFIIMLAGITVDECPKSLANIPSVTHHSLYLPEDKIRIPLALVRIISYFPCCKPRGEEVGTLRIVLALTPAMTSWNSHNSIHQKQEESMVDLRKYIKHAQNRKFVVSSIVSRT